LLSRKLKHGSCWEKDWKNKEYLWALIHFDIEIYDFSSIIIDMRKLTIILIAIAIAICSSGEMAKKPVHRGIVAFFRPDNWNQRVDAIRSMPQSHRRTRAINFFKQVNQNSFEEFVDELDDSPIAGNIVVEKSLWLGNSAIVRYSDPEILDYIMQFSSVRLAFEDIDGFKAVADASNANALEIVWGVSHIGATSCWTAGFEGQNVIAAVFDSGVRYSHRDLENNMWQNTDEIPGNGIDDDGNGYNDDYYGYDFYNGDSDPMDDYSGHYHGTHCAGIIAGDGTFGTQTGVAPSASIMALKVMSSAGSGSASALVSAIQYAIENGANVLSMSFGWPNPSDEIKNYMRPVMEDILTAGLVASVAAGNSGDDGIPVPQCMDSPADCPSPWRETGEGTARTAAIAVGGTNISEGIGAFSSFGPTHWNTGTYTDYPYPPGLMKPDICAPGVSIKSTFGTSDEAYYTQGGTSMAAPHVTGAIAVLLSKNPGLTPEEIDSVLQYTAIELGDAGKDSIFGAGRIRLYNALLVIAPPENPALGYLKYAVDDTTIGNGNSIMEPGETARLLVELKNFGIDAAGVYATISVSSPHVSVSDDYGSYEDFATGEIRRNTGDPFVIEIGSDATPGMAFDVYMTINADGGYVWHDTFKVAISNYPREVADLDNGTFNMTVSNFGQVGFYDPTAASPNGNGFVYDGYNYLYTGGFYLGFSYDDVSTGESGNFSEIKPVSRIEIWTPGSASDYQICGSFVDHDARVCVDISSVAWDSAPDNDFAIFRCILTNISSSSLSELYFGLYLDYDVHIDGGSTWFDRAEWDSINEWGYMYDFDSPPVNPAYVGIAGITDVSRGSVVHNPTHVYPAGMGFVDSVKYNFLSGAFSLTSGDYNSDWALIIGDGPINLASNEADTFAYAVLAGDSLTDFEGDVGAARGLADEILHIEQNMNAKPQNPMITVYPNPFNSRVRFQVSGVGEQGIEFEIFDLRGNVVGATRCVAQKQCDAAHRSYIWQPDKSIGSGIFLVRVHAGNQIRTKKILYLK